MIRLLLVVVAVIFGGIVFSTMTPEDKAHPVEAVQNIDWQKVGKKTEDLGKATRDFLEKKLSGTPKVETPTATPPTSATPPSNPTAEPPATQSAPQAQTLQIDWGFWLPIIFVALGIYTFYRILNTAMDRWRARPAPVVAARTPIHWNWVLVMLAIVAALAVLIFKHEWLKDAANHVVDVLRSLTGASGWTATAVMLLLSAAFAVVAIVALLRSVWSPVVNLRPAIAAGIASALLFLFANGAISTNGGLWPWSTQTARTGEGTCDGRPRAVSLGSNFSRINGGADCKMNWGLEGDPVELAERQDGKGYRETFAAAREFDNRAKFWRCSSGACSVVAVFCPQSTPWWDQAKEACTSTKTRTANR